jgi:predicted peptidase
MSCRFLGFLVLLLLTAQGSASATSRHETGFLDRSVVVDGVEYRYEVYVPRDFDPRRTWPIILMLHGGGDYGSDGIRPSAGALATAIRLHPERFPAIAVFAQGHADGTPSWQGQGGKAALEEVDQSIAEFHGDPSRIYITGASAGGNGAWFLIFHHPERFAGALIACGFVSEFTGLQSHLFYPSLAGQGPDRYAKVAGAAQRLPIWIVHGDADKNVSVEESRAMAAALKALGADVHYTELSGADHKGAWEFAYADEEIVTWLLAQRRR